VNPQVEQQHIELAIEQHKQQQQTTLINNEVTLQVQQQIQEVTPKLAIKNKENETKNLMDKLNLLDKLKNTGQTIILGDQINHYNLNQEIENKEAILRNSYYDLGKYLN
jgi:hypothetical protein